MASTDSEPVKHKTCVLRVSIHCEGCKRKVIKILQSIPGVDGIEIERQYQRVVVTGDVSPESLVRKLVKSGKNAELWPENPPPVQGPDTGKFAGKEDIAVSGKEIKPPASKTEVPAVDSSEASDPGGQGGVAPAGNGGRKVNKDGRGVKVNVSGGGDGGIGGSGGGGGGDGGDGGKVDGGDGDGGSGGGNGGVGGKVNEGGSRGKGEEKKPETGSASDPASPAAVEKKQQETENNGSVVGGGGGGGDGDGKKKKKKKKEGQNSNLDNTGETSSSVPGPVPAATTTRSTNQSPPRNHGYRYPAPYRHMPSPPLPQPVYTMSYNTAQPPVNSYTASYYAAAPPQYAYSHFGPATGPQPLPLNVPSEYEPYAQQPADSFEMFSDENPNGCSIM